MIKICVCIRTLTFDPNLCLDTIIRMQVQAIQVVDYYLPTLIPYVKVAACP